MTRKDLRYRPTGRLNQKLNDGLFSQVIFGPVKNWCCKCGKYQGIEVAEKTCEVCQVKIVSSSVRSENMAHISLPYPFIHPFYIDQVGILLGIDKAKLEEILSFKAYWLTKINNDVIQDLLSEINTEAASRIKRAESEYKSTKSELLQKYHEDSESNMYSSELKKASEARVQKILNITEVKKAAQDELNSLTLNSFISTGDSYKLSQKFPNSF